MKLLSEEQQMPKNKLPNGFPCHCCGKPACYGKDGVWYCTYCWQAADVNIVVEINK